MGLEFVNQNPLENNEGGIEMPDDLVEHAEGIKDSEDVKAGEAVGATGVERIGYKDKPTKEEVARGNEMLVTDSEASFSEEGIEDKEKFTEADAFFAKHGLGAVFDEYQDLDDLPEVKSRIMNGIKPQIDSFLEVNKVDSLSRKSKDNLISAIVSNLGRLK